jgi:hypothetical protein
MSPQTFVIVATGPGATDRAELVIEPATNRVKRFGSRREARAYADSIRPAMPSKYLPLRVRLEA